MIAGSVGLSAETNSMVTTNQVAITPDFLAGLGNEARDKQPAIAAAIARTEAAQAHAESVRKWNDPILRSGVVAATPSRMRADDGDFQIGIEQKLPLFKKPDLARKVALAERDQREAEADRVAKLINRQIAEKIYAAAFADRMVELIRQDAAWIDALAATMEIQFALGKVTQSELLRIQAERARRAEELRIESRHRDHGRLELNRILNRPLHDFWPTLQMPTLFNALEDTKRLVEVALKFEPNLKVLDREWATANAAVDQTRASRKPDVSVGVEGRSRIETGGFRSATVYFNVNLPWWNRDKYAKDLEREHAKARGVELELETERLRVAEEIHRLFTEIENARSTAIVQRDEVTPRAEQALASSRAAWESGKGMYRDVIDSRRMLVEAQMAFARATTEQHKLLVNLALCCGIPNLKELERFAQPLKLEEQP